MVAIRDIWICLRKCQIADVLYLFSAVSNWISFEQITKNRYQINWFGVELCNNLEVNTSWAVVHPIFYSACIVSFGDVEAYCRSASNGVSP